MDITQYIEAAVLWATTIVGAASMIVAAVNMIAKITPTPKDDAFMAKVGVWIEKAKTFLGYIALNPTKKPE